MCCSALRATRTTSPPVGALLRSRIFGSLLNARKLQLRSGTSSDFSFSDSDPVQTPMSPWCS